MLTAAHGEQSDDGAIVRKAVEGSSANDSNTVQKRRINAPLPGGDGEGDQRPSLDLQHPRPHRCKGR